MSNLSYTTSYASPVNFPHASQRVPDQNTILVPGLLKGPLLIQDYHHIDVLANLTRERIPERLVHAKGAGAHGYFEVTKDTGKNYTSQALLQTVGKRVPATVRFSTVVGESGSADTHRDTGGFGIKLKTEQGIWDWVFLTSPVFFIRDPAKYPDLVHATKRNPQTNSRDPNMFWDYMSQNPETIHQLMMVFSPRGTPDGYHRQHGFGSNTFKWVKEENNTSTFVYVKVHVRRTDGVKTLTDAEATRLAGVNPDYNTQQLYQAIEDAKNNPTTSKFPEWTVSIQTMTETQANSDAYRHIAFDATKIWPQGATEFPLQEIGKLVLDENPDNYFDEIEQLAFAPAQMVPYIEPSPDPLLHARLFIYPDAQRYRLGVNHKHLPCNDPSVKLNKAAFPGLTLPTVANHQRAGAASYKTQGNRPNYQSSTQSLSFTGPKNAIDSQMREVRHEVFNGTAYRDQLLPADLTDLDFAQSRALWNSWDATEKQVLIDTVAASLKPATAAIRSNQLLVFGAVDQVLARDIAVKMGDTYANDANPLAKLVANLKVIKKDLN